MRRLAKFLEASIVAGLTWTVFEPNAPALWSAITESVNAFLMSLFTQGAFRGSTASEAFNVTTQADIENGLVSVIVAFAPLRPAEFELLTNPLMTLAPPRP
jgi:hypothetical protein